MESESAGGYPASMSESMDQELVHLIALLRNRPKDTSYLDVVDRVVNTGTATGASERRIGSPLPRHWRCRGLLHRFGPDQVPELDAPASPVHGPPGRRVAPRPAPT